MVAKDEMSKCRRRQVRESQGIKRRGRKRVYDVFINSIESDVKLA